MIGDNNKKRNRFIEKQIVQYAYTKLEYFVLSCRNGYLYVVKWLKETFAITQKDNVNDAFQWSCYNGHLSVAKWLYETFKITKDVVKTKCIIRHLSVAEWLSETFDLVEDELLCDMFID